MKGGRGEGNGKGDFLSDLDRIKVYPIGASCTHGGRSIYLGDGAGGEEGGGVEGGGVIGATA